MIFGLCVLLAVAAVQAQGTNEPHTMKEVCPECHKHEHVANPSTWDTVKDTVVDTGKKIADTVSDLKGSWEPIKEEVEEAKEKAAETAEGYWDKLKKRADDVHAKEAEVLKHPNEYWSEMKNGAKHAAAEVASTVKKAVDSVLPEDASTVSDIAKNIKEAVLPAEKHVADDLSATAKKAAEAVLPKDASERVPEKMADVCPECHKTAPAEQAASTVSDFARKVKDAVLPKEEKKPLKDLKDAASTCKEGLVEAVTDLKDDIKAGVRDTVTDLKQGAEDMTTRAAEAVKKPFHDLKAGADGVKAKVADAVPDVSWQGIKEGAEAVKTRVAEAVSKPWQDLKHGAEDIKEKGQEAAARAQAGVKAGAERMTDKASDMASAEGGPRAKRGDWWSQMMSLRQSLEKQMHDATEMLWSDDVERVSFVQQNVERVNNSWINYLNDNGKEYLDIVLPDGMKDTDIDPLKAINSARVSHGMPARLNLTDVSVQVHHRQAPHFYLRSTRILPNGAWTQYENDNGVELITEGRIAKKAIHDGPNVTTTPDKHPLLNMFRRTFGLPELVEKAF